MTDHSQRPIRRRTPGHVFGALCVSLALLVTLSACGISVGEGSPDTEIFKKLSVEGPSGDVLTAGEVLKITVDYEQPYPVTIRVECNLLAGSDETAVLATPTPNGPWWSHEARAGKVLTILPAKALDANPEKNLPDTVKESLVDEATPVAGSFEQSFRAPDLPGVYFVECYTQQDDNNFIRKRITLVSAPEATATPGPGGNDLASGGP